MSRPYASPSRKAQAEATKRRILLALVDLLVEERPATVSIPQVARRAGASVRIVYHYFPTKEALFDGLTAAIDGIVTVPDGVALPAASTPAELVAAIPAAHRYFAANRRVFKALAVSELGEQVTASRFDRRRARIEASLEPLRDRLDEDELRRLGGLVGLLTSFEGFDTLTSLWELSEEEAAQATAWAVTVLCDRARRSAVAR
jgi:AcrR family transcriptional regulator